MSTLIAVAFAGCDGDDAGHHERNSPLDQHLAGLIESSPLVQDGGRSDGPLFVRLTAERTGIDFVYQLFLPEGHDDDFATTLLWAGVCIADYDDDGRPDVYLSRPHGGNRLYRNLGDFRFQDVTDEAGVTDDDVWGMAGTFADLDNDGDLDLYVCIREQPNQLYMNQGDGTFVKQPKASGLDFSGASVIMAFADYDLDGDLDGYLLTNELRTTEGTVLGKFDIVDGKPVVPKDLVERIDVIVRPDRKVQTINVGQYDHLYRNNGDGTFTDVSEQAGLYGNHKGLGVVWWDYDADGLPDIYVSNDFWGGDHLYHNNGDGTFTDVVGQAMPHTPWSSMGADVADINNDGRLDFLASDMAATNHYNDKVAMGGFESHNWFLTYPEPRQYARNAVYLNTGTERFMEVAHLTRLANADWAWAVKFGDLDNDGLVDLYIANGMTRDWENPDIYAVTYKFAGRSSLSGRNTLEGRRFWLSQPRKLDANLAFRNRGDLHFENVGQAWGLGEKSVSFGAAFGDLDGDGDLDLVVNDYEEPVKVYRNRLPSPGSAPGAGHRVKIRLQGTVSNRHGIGSRLTIQTASGIQVRYLTLVRGFMSADEPLAHFGLGQDAQIDQLTVQWPSGHQQIFHHLDADRFYTITEPKGAATPPPAPKPEPPMFTPSKVLAQAKHQEKPYDDFKQRQPLLPNKLSQLGPGLAWGDADGDGRQDLYLSGAARHVGRLYLNKGKGKFLWASYITAFYTDLKCEDMASLWFDADQDGDLDLYVVSGGVESDLGSPLLRDRLYLNDGKANFTKAPEGTIPDEGHSGSVVSAADFDRDGDLDLFVGGRVIPGQYPLPPNSRLLRNDRGRFTDVTDQLAPGLGQSGLVTSALWSDTDGDRWVDLLVSHEWGPVKLYQNTEGRLTDRTGPAGLADRLGWFNSIAGRDLDGDGDMDYVVCGFGLNTKYNATLQKPLYLFYGDMEGLGRMRLVEAYYEGDTLYPVRGRTSSVNAMPTLAERFPTFHDFAMASVQEIYTPQCLAEAHRFEANTLESTVLLNDGTGRFTFQPLPRLAQASPGFGVVLTEVDGDGHADLYMVQNFYSPHPATGRMDGGVSLLLTGQGNGQFTPVWPATSGLVVPGDATALTETDLNADGWPDFVVGINDGVLMAFENRGSSTNRIVNVRLKGPVGNADAIGAQVTVDLASGLRQTAEVYAGGGYLSQSSPQLTFGLGPSGHARRIEVRWPDGTNTTMTPPQNQQKVIIEHPAIPQPESLATR